MADKKQVYFIGKHQQYNDHNCNWSNDLIRYDLGFFDDLTEAMIKVNELALKENCPVKSYFIQEGILQMTNKHKVRAGHYETKFVWN